MLVAWRRSASTAWRPSTTLSYSLLLRRLGHESITTTQRVYGHLRQDDDAAILGALDNVLVHQTGHETGVAPAPVCQTARVPLASSRRPALDGLRGIAALVVVVHHSLLVAPTLADRYAATPMPSADTWSWWVTYTPLHLVWAGREAVLVFFVLSGLVLALPAATGKEVWWRSYYPQRLLRLYLPIFAATALAYVLVAAVPRHPHAGSSSWLRGYTSPIGLHETVKDAVVVKGSSSLNAAFWSLQWEVYFSVLLPVFVVALVSLRRGLVVRMVVLFAVIAYGNKSGDRWFFYMPIFGLGVLMAQQLSRLDAAGARFDRLKPAVRRLTYGGVASLLVARWLIAAVDGGNTVSTTGSVLTVVGACLCVWMFASTRAGNRLGTRLPVAWLGKRSFSLYLIHEPIVVTVAYLLHGTTDAALVLMIALPASLIAAEAFGRLCEMPSHRFAQSVGRRLRPARVDQHPPRGRHRRDRTEQLFTIT
jgi:peptidoglycan/LPS O-acetylase OafA/YrhL